MSLKAVVKFENVILNRQNYSYVTGALLFLFAC